MPTLHWVGKEKVVNHHHDVPFQLLEPQYSFNAAAGTPENATDNRIIHGDNLAALKSLLPEFEGKVNCIYIDPPYNTGNEGWVYNDNVNDPKMKKWLGQVVGKEGEDLSRHDKWLCMMYPRLKLLHRLLASDGVIFISIDDGEQASLKLMLDEIFGQHNHLANVVWQKRTSPDARLNLGPAHDYIVCYGKQLGLVKTTLNKVPLSGARTKDFKNPDNDPRGVWASVDLTGQIGHATKDQFFDVVTPSGKTLQPPANRCWALTKATFEQLVADNRIWFGTKGDSRPRQKKFLAESEGANVWTWWPNTEVGHNQEATKELLEIFNSNISFETPKPSRLIHRVLQLATNKNSIILDSFAGSGTTAHAVLKLNAQDGGRRRFILCEMMDYAETITAERVRRVMDGYGEGNKAVAGTGGGFVYYSLGERLFNDDSNLNENVGAAAICRYVAYSEGIPHDKQSSPNYPLLATISPYALGLHEQTLWIFYYQAEAVTTLSLDFLGQLNINAILTAGLTRPSHFVIYADKCTLTPEFLYQHGITFKRIPRDITRF